MKGVTEYQIGVKGQLDPKIAEWFGDLAISHTPDGETLLTGTIIDQAAMYGVVERCRDLGLTLISVNPLQTERRENKGKTMSWIHAEESYVINARAEDLYAVVTDYHVGHPAIVPKPYFTDLTVEKGGQGTGTIIRGNLRVFGKDYPFHQLVSEPEPGRIILETDIETGQRSRFTFEPLSDGSRTRVTIASDFPPSKGFVGFMERFTKPSFVRMLYKKELRNLADYVRSKQAVAATN
jgi:Polyketide cyclase / dehydrase and lipid transport